MTQKDNWLDWAIRLQSLSQAGLAYSTDIFDRERFEEIRQIAAQMLVEPSGLPLEKVQELFCNEAGYQTPKLDTRAAIFNDQKILLVQEKDGLWTLPGGWCDVDQSVMENTLKEVKEEAGLDVRAEKIIAILDKSKHNGVSSAHRITAVFVHCTSLGGQFVANSETIACDYFSLEDLPDLAQKKTTVQQLAMCFEALAAEHWQTQFD